MFAEHQAVIAAFARESAENTFLVLRFAQATIHKKFYQVRQALEDLDENRQSRLLSGRQNDAIAEYWNRREEIYSKLHDHRTTLNEKMFFLVTLPGFGIPKAGFVLQLLLGKVGCLDTRNLKRFGLDAKVFRHGNCSTETVLERTATYIAVCENYGTDYLWNSWCEDVAYSYSDYFTDAENVSYYHVECIMHLSETPV